MQNTLNYTFNITVVSQSPHYLKGQSSKCLLRLKQTFCYELLSNKNSKRKRKKKIARKSWPQKGLSIVGKAVNATALLPAPSHCDDTIWMSTDLSSHHSLWPSHFQVPWSLSLVGVVHCPQHPQIIHIPTMVKILKASLQPGLSLCSLTHWLIAHSEAPQHKHDPATYWLMTQTFYWNLMQGPMIPILKFGVPEKNNIMWTISMIAPYAVSVRGNQSPLDQGCRSVWVLL